MKCLVWRRQRGSSAHRLAPVEAIRWSPQRTNSNRLAAKQHQSARRRLSARLAVGAKQEPREEFLSASELTRRAGAVWSERAIASVHVGGFNAPKEPASLVAGTIRTLRLAGCATATRQNTREREEEPFSGHRRPEICHLGVRAWLQLINWTCFSRPSD